MSLNKERSPCYPAWLKSKILETIKDHGCEVVHCCFGEADGHIAQQCGNEGFISFWSKSQNSMNTHGHLYVV